MIIEINAKIKSEKALEGDALGRVRRKRRLVKEEAQG
jgi:hypothetical protein